MKRKKPHLEKRIYDVKRNIFYKNCNEASEHYKVCVPYIRAICRGERKSKKINLKYE